MPLTKFASKKAFSRNVAIERKAGRSVKQAMAIAFATKRASVNNTAPAKRKVYDTGAAPSGRTSFRR